MSSSNTGSKARILIVEDSPTQAEQLQNLLCNAGYNVDITANGKKALNFLEENHSDLIISDIIMPELDGYELCRIVKNDERFKKIPVILVTALYDPQDVIRGLESGANNFIIKPYDEKYLLSRIDIVLANTLAEDTDVPQMGLDITFSGKKHHITSSRLQILNILLSTYETAIQKNQELDKAKKDLRLINEHLEETVAKRTAELEETNKALNIEIEQRKRTEIALIRKTRAYQVISECNRHLIRGSDEISLVNCICSILVTTGGYRCAWVGYCEGANNCSLKPIAQSGFEDEYLHNLRNKIHNKPFNSGPSFTAIKTGKASIIQDIFSYSENRSWKSEALVRKYFSIAAVPLMIQGEIMGTLTIYSGDQDAFDKDEIRLLSEMADDLAYGIMTLRTRIAHDQAEQELKRSELRYRRLFEAAKDGILILDGDSEEIVDANPAFLDLFDIPLDSILGKQFSKIGLIPNSSEKTTLNQDKGVNYGSTFQVAYFIHSDGSKRYVEYIKNIYLVNSNKIIQCNIRDITGRKKMEDEIAALNRDLELRVAERTDQLMAMNQELQSEIEERVQAGTIAQETLSLLNAIIESTADGLMVVGLNRRITKFNQIFALMWDIPQYLLDSRDDINTLNSMLNKIKNVEEFLEKVNILYANPGQEQMDIIELADGRIFERYSKPQRIGDKIVGRVFSFRDVTRRKKMEQQIKDSLREKEFLLKEIHHRVKNNMQVVASLLYMQAQTVQDVKTLNLLKDSQNRIRSIALVHEKLYQSKSLDQIDYSTYLDEFMRYLVESYNIDRNRITLSILAEDVLIPINIAAPLSLIIHEIVSNSLKHAFPGDKKGNISITISKDNTGFYLQITDNGIGIPENISMQKTGTMGMQLISGLTKQIRGTISLDRTNGTRYEIRIPHVMSSEESSFEGRPGK